MSDVVSTQTTVEQANRETASMQFIARVRSLLTYDSSTGEFYWNVARSQLKAGARAGSRLRNGRYRISIDDVPHYSHRLAFVIMLGRFPVEYIDHIDGNPSNNAWANLRECSHAQNMQNKATYRNNRAKVIGVSPSPSGCPKPWRATIKVNGRCHHLGTFDTVEEAHKRYLAAKQSMHKFNPTLRRDA